MYTTIFDKSLLLWFIGQTVILCGIVGKFCSRYCFDWQYYRHSGITLDRHHKTHNIVCDNKRECKNNEIPSVCIVLISSLANINIIYAIDCSKIFFFCRLKKNLDCSIVWCIGYLMLNQLSKVFFNWKQMQLIWRGGDVCNLLSFTTSLTNQFPAKSQL